MAASSDARDRGERLFCDIGGITVALQSQDLNPVGLFVPTDQPIEVDREFELNLRSPLGEMRAKAHVVQVVSIERARIENKRAGCAMVFIDLAEDQRVWIGLTLAALKRPQPATQTTLRGIPRVMSGPSRAQRAAAEVSRAAAAVASNPSTPASAPAPNPQQQHWQQQRPQIRDRLRQELGAIDGKSPWEILGVGQNADVTTAKRAFLAMSKRYHPHAYARFDCPEISRMATQLFIAHKRAYSRMTTTRPPAPTTTPSLSMAPVRVTESKRPRGGGEP